MPICAIYAKYGSRSIRSAECGVDLTKKPFSAILEETRAKKTASVWRLFVGARGFEPRTSRTRTVRSSRAEPRPVRCSHYTPSSLF